VCKHIVITLYLKCDMSIQFFFWQGFSFKECTQILENIMCKHIVITLYLKCDMSIQFFFGKVLVLKNAHTFWKTS
jgi:hypothetical protein